MQQFTYAAAPTVQYQRVRVGLFRYQWVPVTTSEAAPLSYGRVRLFQSDGGCASGNCRSR